MSIYTARIVWTNDVGQEFEKNRFSRGHQWEFDGGVTVHASASPQVVRLPFSVEAAVDPEEALVAAAASCHMLTFLWLAAKGGYVVESYEDNAEGFMTEGENGKHWISRIVLDPKIVFADDDRKPNAEELGALHHAAHEQCYIANSIKSEIVVSGND